jgi:hypothetical protein
MRDPHVTTAGNAKQKPDGGKDNSPARETGKKRRWAARVIIWAVPVGAAAVLASYTVPGAHRAETAATCIVKYVATSPAYRPASTAWTPYGSTEITETRSALAVRPDPQMGAADEWFGASLNVTKSCDYHIGFNAYLIGPLYQVAGSGYGYAIGARGHVDNGVPYASTIQYDPPFGGLRTVDVPNDANLNGLNAIPFQGIVAGRSHHWDIVVRGDNMVASLDGRKYPPVELDTGGGEELIVRVWNAQVIIAGVTITKLSPQI